MSVEIDGDVYITGAEYAAEFGLDASGLRHAYRNGRLGEDASRMAGAKTRMYRLDRIEAWRETVKSRDWEVGRRPGTVSRIAHRYDLDRTMVYRALKSGALKGRQDPKGVWSVSPRAAADWAHEYLGIDAPVNTTEPERGPADWDREVLMPPDPE